MSRNKESNSFAKFQKLVKTHKVLETLQVS